MLIKHEISKINYSLNVLFFINIRCLKYEKLLIICIERYNKFTTFNIIIVIEIRFLVNNSSCTFFV